jgi:hypothetical protein
VGGDTKDAGADPAEIPVDERSDGPGVSRIDPNDPAAPIYRLLEKMRSPLTLRDMMICRSGSASFLTGSTRQICHRVPRRFIRRWSSLRFVPLACRSGVQARR